MDDQAAIRALLDRYTAAIRNKDAKATVQCYSDDAIAYDLAPPLSIGPDGLRDPSNVQEWFDTWDGPIQSDAHDLTVRCGGDMGYAYALRHMTGTKKGGQHVDLWFRATATFVKRQGSWKIAHVHNSVPFAMDGSDKALLDLKPETKRRAA
jgi:uncharacterized protein (TIGR02246 family)